MTAPTGDPDADYGEPGASRCSTPTSTGEPSPDEELERLRILARTPRWGREIDDRILPAEAGLDERAVCFTKGCYPGQEPLARLHYRGHVNRTPARARARRASAARTTPRCARARSARRPGHERRARRRRVALAYVRVEVPDDAELEVGDRRARLHWPPTRP